MGNPLTQIGRKIKQTGDVTHHQKKNRRDGQQERQFFGILERFCQPLGPGIFADGIGADCRQDISGLGFPRTTRRAVAAIVA